MTKIGFGRQPRNAVGTLQNADMGETQPACAFEPVVVHGSGIEAIIEGLRLADVEGVEAIAAGLQCAKDVNRSERLELLSLAVQFKIVGIAGVSGPIYRRHKNLRLLALKLCQMTGLLLLGVLTGNISHV